MNILHVLRAPVGGLFRHVADLAGGQIARGHSVGIVADSSTGNAPSEEILARLAPKLSLGLSRIPMRRQPSPADVAAVWHVARRIADTGAEIVHGHGAKGGALARLAPARSGIVRAYTPHGGSLHDAVGGRIHIMLERALMRRGNLYLFESAYSHDAFHRKVGKPDGAVRVVHNGVHQAELEPIAPAADATDIVFLGELRGLKGVDVLIDAIAILRRSGCALTATIVGDGPDAAALRAQSAEIGLGDAVKFHAPLPTRRALALGRMVVMPSRAESLPYVILEAAAAGKPLIATHVGGIPEVFAPMAGRLVPPDNAAALAKAITEIVDSPAVAEQATQRLRARIAEVFSVEAMVDAVVSSYHLARAGLAGAQIAHETAQSSSGAAMKGLWPAGS
jgi:glycosyltransferase involved in cell wall biosynthesis